MSDTPRSNPLDDVVHHADEKTVEPGSPAYWDGRYASIGPTQVSWFQAYPTPSLALISLIGLDAEAPIVDVGGGASRLVDALAQEGYSDLTVVDMSQQALDAAAAWMPGVAVNWVQADVRSWQPDRTFALWHDRAAYHFLIDPADQQRYWDNARAHVMVGGHIVIATFSPDSAPTCSGLPVARYDAGQLAEAMGSGFEIVRTDREVHVTPAGLDQYFTWMLARRVADPGQS